MAKLKMPVCGLMGKEALGCTNSIILRKILDQDKIHNFWGLDSGIFPQHNVHPFSSAILGA
jgi:hypothetical protein